MNNLGLFFSLNFRPVGQGLFAHGSLQFSDESDSAIPSFEWVYDCGAEKLGTYLLPQITAYDLHNPADIDLLIFSHFDQDHVVGVRELLRTKRPKVIVAPYLSLAERLAYMSALRPTDVGFARALVAPAAFLRGVAGDGARLVFVVPGGGQYQIKVKEMLQIRITAGPQVKIIATIGRLMTATTSLNRGVIPI